MTPPKKRRVFTVAEKLRIVRAAAACPPGEVVRAPRVRERPFYGDVNTGSPEA